MRDRVAGSGRAMRGAIAAALVVLAAAAAGAGPQAPWVAHLRAADEALARGDPRGASRALLRAGAAARHEHGWGAVLAVGDAARRLALATGEPGFAVEARASYLAGLLRARAQGAADGVMRACQGLDQLDRRDLVEFCVTIAQAVERERAATPSGSGPDAAAFW